MWWYFALRVAHPLLASEIYPHPLEDHRPRLYNPVTGQVSPSVVNVTESNRRRHAEIIHCQCPDGFYSPISSPIKTMAVIKKRVKSNKVSPVIDIVNIFLRLLMIGQRRQLTLEPLFAYELCAVPDRSSTNMVVFVRVTSRGWSNALACLRHSLSLLI